MLENTFLHIPGIGPKKEKALWNSGVCSLNDLEKALFSQTSLLTPNDEVSSSEFIFRATKEALENEDAEFFAEHLPKREHYRIALSYPEDTVFLDIETTGLSYYYDIITLVGIGTIQEYFCHFKGQNKTELLSRIAKAKCLVTFNGTMFDTKFILKEFPEAKIPKAHVDLRFAAKRVDLSGGQKKIETEIGLNREAAIKGVSGEQAPLLWHEYRLGDIDSGRELVSYNHADIEGMKFIFDEVVSRLHKRDGNPPHKEKQIKFSAKPNVFSFSKSMTNLKRNSIFVPLPPKKSGPRITYKKLIKGIGRNNLRVVGIDLTGSESRPTGWALLHGNQTITQRIGSDANLIVETLLASPDLVSIDSPLSMPKGRTRVTDDDPGRDEFGIMRECELTLKRRGVNVYPSLIPSMQRLTERGMRLAEQFRRLGMPVIESYPGAAQDIMNIPRKRAGLDYLKKGLSDFGIEGAFLDNDVSHDEVDAITSAIVGLFFWTGNFEALGNEDEDYLIIPDLTSPHPNWHSRRVVGISGPIAAGKTTAGRFWQQKFSYEYTRYSEAIDRQLESEGVVPTRETRQEFGRRVYQELGQRWLSRMVVEPYADNEDIVIDGLRFPEDHAYMIEKFGPAFFHVHIRASEKVRKKRYVKGSFKVKDFEAATTHMVEQKVAVLARLADATIKNENKLGTLERSLRETHRGIKR